MCGSILGPRMDAPTNPPRTRFDIGAVRVDRVVEFQNAFLNPLQVFADATATDIASQLDWLAPRFYDPVADAIVTSVQAFLIRTRGKAVVVDTCSGDCKDRKRYGFSFRYANLNVSGTL